MMDKDQREETGVSVLVVLSDFINDLRALMFSIPRLSRRTVGRPKWQHIAVKIVDLIIFLPVLFTVGLVLAVVEFALIFWFVFSRMDQAGQRHNSWAIEIVKYTQSGERISVGGKKGGRSRFRLDPIKKRNEEILGEARKMMASGKEFSQLSGILLQRYSGRDDYPSSQRQYTNILKPLRDEINGN